MEKHDSLLAAIKALPPGEHSFKTADGSHWNISLGGKVPVPIGWRERLAAYQQALWDDAVAQFPKWLDALEESQGTNPASQP